MHGIRIKSIRVYQIGQDRHSVIKPRVDDALEAVVIASHLRE
jgi:hypothetical protein